MQMMPADSLTPRFYHLLLQKDLIEGWTLIREWGIQGSSGRVKKAHHDTRLDAEEDLMRYRDAQLLKGYRVVFATGECSGE